MRASSLLILAACAGSIPAFASAPAASEPYALIGIADSGIEPYHLAFYRPDRTAHPCTYVPGLSCAIPALPLTVGTSDRNAARQADFQIWGSIVPGQWYWIPRTVFVAIACAPNTSQNNCIEDEPSHGTGVVSAALTENPDAVVAFHGQGSPADQLGRFAEAGIPLDVVSLSYGPYQPQPLPYVPATIAPLFVNHAGNQATTTLLDSGAADPRVISVGGAYAHVRSSDALAEKDTDVVSYYCRDVADATNVSKLKSSCGTSFAAPTVAGALSKVVLELRRAGVPIDGPGIREALNATATYAPEPRWSATSATPPIPLDEERPWIQWGWGFYDRTAVDATIAHILGEPAPPKPAQAVEHMERVYTARSLLYG